VGSEEPKSKRLNPIKRKHMEDRVRELEQEITRMEAAIADCESALQTFVSAGETQRLTQQLGEHKRSLQASVKEWEKLGQALEA
jgi:predicted  nucleic acid-binding Zn-ribbon protein